MKEWFLKNEENWGDNIKIDLKYKSQEILK
jgi:hypothetical protein